MSALANLPDVRPVRTTETQGLQRFTANSRLWLLVVGALGVLGAWPGADFGPRTGLDAGWQLGINLASSIGLNHGTDVMWTYGPLGPLTHPVALDGFTMSASLVTWLLIHVAFVASLFALFRPAVGYDLGAIIAVSLVLTFPEQYIAERWSIALIAYAWLYATRPLPRAAAALPVLFGAATALLVCAKAGASVPAFLITSVALWWVGKWRALLSFVMSGVITIVGVWLVTGNDPSTIIPYVRGSFELAAGFAEGMSTRSFARYPEEYLFEYISLGAIISAVLGIWWHRRKAEASWWLLTVIAGLGVWHWFRYSYIRPDGRRAIVFWFLAMVATLLLIRGREHLRIGIAVIVVCLAFAEGVTSRNLFDSLNVAQGVRNLEHHFLMAASSAAREERLAEARDESEEAFAIPDGLIGVLKDAPGVHVDSYQLATVWTYGLEWMPVPVFQSYSAYSPGLDTRNATSLDSFPTGHAVLRREEPAIDGRFRRFDSPEYVMAMACLYVHEVTRAGWQVLLKGANRCGIPRFSSSIEVRSDDVVPIPEVMLPGSMMTARVQLYRNALYEILRFVFRPREAVIHLDGGAYRFIRGTSGGPLILSFPEHPSFALGHLQHDGPASFDTIGLSGLYSDAVIEFWEVPVDLG